MYFVQVNTKMVGNVLVIHLILQAPIGFCDHLLLGSLTMIAIYRSRVRTIRYEWLVLGNWKSGNTKMTNSN